MVRVQNKCIFHHFGGCWRENVVSVIVIPHICLYIRDKICHIQRQSTLVSVWYLGLRTQCFVWHFYWDSIVEALVFWLTYLLIRMANLASMALGMVYLKHEI